MLKKSSKSDPTISTIVRNKQTATVLKKLFGFDPKTTTVRTELLAGVTTFLTMSYILAVNPAMFSQLEGMTAGAVFTATALAAIVGTLAMALIGKMPFGLAPGMGLNAFFVYTVCMGMGYSWQFALTAVFIEGIIFIILTLTNLREAIVNAIPTSLKNAIGAGIGLFIALIGLQNAGIVVNNDATLVSLGEITSGSPLLGLIGLLITGILVVKNVHGGLLIGILITAIIGIPMGITEFNGIVSAPHSVSDIFCQFEWDNIFTLDMLVIVFTFMFIDLFDTVGTLVGVCTKAGMADKNGKIDRLNHAFMADAIATTAGACLGTSTTTTYVESAVYVRLAPFHNFAKLCPVFHFFKGHMFYGRARDNHAVEGLFFYVVKSFVKSKQMVFRYVLRLMGFGMDKLHFHLQRGVSQKPSKLRLRFNLFGH